ncbi:MAG: NADH ubiquinone oxidoreductase [Rhodospirillaceae bacterium]|nr:NADH ubiquinone oxidoreductase [Rhodospirillaceae bacterium]|tara:strand:+ start:1072 stop:1674 length:603 start_codon:yes stop_codon:yes gene_type:complete
MFLFVKVNENLCWRLKMLKYVLLILPLMMFSVSGLSKNKNMLIDDFTNKPEKHWKFITDQVMGGVSNGKLNFFQENGRNCANMSGNVSTANNGGFIQFRKKLKNPPKKIYEGLKLVARGNNQTYFIHLRTRGTFLPWQYYQAPFRVSKDWAAVEVKFSDFKRSGILLREKIDPKSLKSVGVVAFGRNHVANVDVCEVSFF